MRSLSAFVDVSFRIQTILLVTEKILHVDKFRNCIVFIDLCAKISRKNRNVQRIWLITGVSGGLGKSLALEAAKQNNFVIGTVRKQEDALDFEKRKGSNGKAIFIDLLEQEMIVEEVDYVLKQYKRVDVLVNNAGYGLIGFLEEANSEEIRKQMEVNFFAPIQLTQLFLPHMRANRRGHIIQISSRLGIAVTSGFSFYAASKFALEGATEALASELSPFQIKVTIVEPGPLRTDFVGRSAVLCKRKLKNTTQFWET